MNMICTVQTLVLAFVVLLVVPSTAQAATLQFKAPEAVSVNEPFTLYVYASSTDRGFNAAEAVVSFPKDILQVDSVDSTGSATFLNFWLFLPVFSNAAGTVRFSGGTIQATLGPDVPLLAIHMHAIGSGDALITAADASINAADGSGTNILDTVRPARVAVRPGKVIVPTKSVATPATAVTSTKSDTAPAVKQQASATTSTTTSGDLCTGPFHYCDIHFPAITGVAVTQQPNWSEVSVSGVASEGTHVHVKLRLQGKDYAEVIATIKPDRTWEARFSEVYAYGVYRIDARAETIDSHPSETVSRNNVYILPPHTLAVGGVIIDWYYLIDALLGLLMLLWAVFVLRTRAQLISDDGSAQPLLSRLVTVPHVILVALLLAFVSMSFFTYYSWNKEHLLAATFWNNSSLPCIRREQSLDAKYGTMQLKVVIDGQTLETRAGMGISTTCIAHIHTHDNTGRFHFIVSPRPVTLQDIALLANIQQSVPTGYVATATLNGVIYSGDISTYSLKDGDSVVLSYSKATWNNRK